MWALRIKKTAEYLLYITQYFKRLPLLCCLKDQQNLTVRVYISFLTHFFTDLLTRVFKQSDNCYVIYNMFLFNLKFTSGRAFC